MYYPEGSPRGGGKLSEELEEPEDHEEHDEEDEPDDREEERERLRQAVEYLSMKEQEMGRQLTEEEYIALLEEAGADEELIFQVMQLGLEETEDEELEQLGRQFAG